MVKGWLENYVGYSRSEGSEPLSLLYKRTLTFAKKLIGTHDPNYTMDSLKPIPGP